MSYSKRMLEDMEVKFIKLPCPTCKDTELRYQCVRCGGEGKVYIPVADYGKKATTDRRNT